MSDDIQATTVDVWPNQKLTDNQERVRSAAELIPVGPSGTNPQNFAQLVDYCKWMSNAKGAVGEHLIGNVGACLAVMEIADKYGLQGYMVARQTYLVNKQIAFMGQLVMSIINLHCPLEKRLTFRFEGEGPDLRVIVTGQFKNETEPLVYRSPPLKDIPVKNSPLWKTDPEQQFCYFGARRWQSRYWPEGLLGIYTPEELAEHPPMQHLGADNAKEVNPLKEKLQQADRSEGHQNGFADAELANLAADKPGVVPKEPEKPAETKDDKPKKGRKKAEAAKPKKAEPEKPVEAKPEDIKVPTTPAQYVVYASAWIEKAKSREDADARWEGEHEMRAELSVPMADRNALYAKIDARFPQ